MIITASAQILNLICHFLVNGGKLFREMTLILFSNTEKSSMSLETLVIQDEMQSKEVIKEEKCTAQKGRVFPRDDALQRDTDDNLNLSCNVYVNH